MIASKSAIKDYKICIAQNVPLKFQYDANFCYKCAYPVTASFNYASLNLPTSQSNPISAQRQRAGQQTQPITESAYSTNTSVPNEWQSSKVRNNSQGISCSVMGAKKVNLHANCDMQNCDGGSSTNAGTADDGTQVVMTGFQVASNLPNVRNWVEIIADGGTYYIAESKLACEQGE